MKSLANAGVPRILLLTATVVPDRNATSGRVVLDPSVRREQYERGVEFYAHRYAHCLDGLVLVENSGADLDSFRRLVPAELPFEPVSVPTEPTTGAMDRGYLETLMVSQGFERSSLLSQPAAVAVKVTGRYRTENLGALLKSMDAECDLGLNLRRHPREWADMWIYFANQRGMGKLQSKLPLLRQAPQGGSAETVMYDIMMALHAEGVAVQRRFSTEPLLTGTRGYDGVRYESAPQRIKWAARTLVKKVAPGVWL